jgi:hypothetical protein
VSAVADMIGALSEICAGLPDQRKGPRRDGNFSMADIGLSAFSMFFMGSPSFLGHQRALAEGHGRSNCETLFGMSAIPSDNYIRTMLDGAAPAAFDGLFIKAIEAAGPLTPFQCLDRRVPIALDGTEHFCSRKIKCQQCSTRRRADGGTEYFHAFLGASMVAPGHKQVLPLPPEFIAPQDGAEKQDCERNAAKRWLARHGAGLVHLRPVYLGDDLFACQPIVTAIHEAGGNFILTCKPSSHQTIAEYLQGAGLQEHRKTICQRGKRTTTVYRWLNAVPLRATGDAILVNWFSTETLNAKGKRTYHNSFVTDLAITPDTVAELAACGRARWKIENETFTCSRPTVTISNTTLGTARKPSPASWSPSTCSPSRFIPPLISGSSPGEPPSSHAARHTASSSICGPSPPTSCSRTGPICSNLSRPRPYGRRDHAPHRSRTKPTQTRSLTFENPCET